MRIPFVAGNWKMHGSKAMIQDHLGQFTQQAEALNNVNIAVCPPSLYVSAVQSQLTSSSVKVGVQNVCDQAGFGAYTGEVSVDMLVDMGVPYAIVGHSERRAFYCETDRQVADKVAIVLDKNLTPILCIGETLEERESDQTEHVVKTQLIAVIEKVGIAAFANIVIAYEPIWAIGTGKTASPEQAQAVHAFIRNLLAQHDTAVAQQVVIQYGGSVKPDNAAALFAQPDIDGGLIGGASLDPMDFLAICKAASQSCLK
ncbi:triose-phosphate isomerase [Thiomicrospira cyclica]|uniref:Triosephosphate isomerase n=1 Tax=Thiomicrospira cyclica (strain DSM 14477 / JCM 11371 / ALM1) TaxID=717773 RepID=F6DC21_THICA|nr:triose-phosphate isomerase [Thiomicrospira cyclica]AEG31407.1 triosephosphate isomerase [Thiomicrospira cyclica ALM1]